jgi:serine/threonine-protein kinase
LETITESKFGSTILVENRANKRLYIIKKHSKGEVGRKEAKVLSSLRNDNINPIYGSGGDSRSTVVISEYAQGGSLADRMVRKYEWLDCMKLAVQIATGISFAHKNNIVHGNLRPSNVLFDAHDIVKLTDFGMPSHYEGKKNWYAPPEHKPSRQGDIYALGVILHQLLLGRTPEYDISDKLKVDQLYMQVPQAVEVMLTKLLAIRVVNRYKSCEEFLADWKEFDDKQQVALRRPVPIVSAAPEQKTSLPNWIWYTVGAAVIVAVIIAIVIKVL